MTYKRIIPVLLLKDGLLVRSQLFKFHQAIGDPIPTIKRLSDWQCDEIILLNIGSSKTLDSRRNDKWHNLGTQKMGDLVAAISKFCFAPLTVGGGIRDLEDINNLFQNGADKCSINTSLFENMDLVKTAIKKYGSQAIVASIDLRFCAKSKKYFCYSHGGLTNTEYEVGDMIKYVQEIGVGEILLSSIDFDGSAQGYDLNILKMLNSIKPKVPIILNSGPGHHDDFDIALENSYIQAAAASNIFYFTESSYPIIKKNIKQQSIIRKVDLSIQLIPREPYYEHDLKTKLMEKLYSKEKVNKEKYVCNSVKKVKFCTRCLYSSASATPMQFDPSGLCMGCITSDAKFKLKKSDYIRRTKVLKKIVESRKNRNQTTYDCIVSVSGGKDSYYQVHYVKEHLGLKPLLVTYNGNNYSQIGWENLMNMREVFDCDHIIVSPSIKQLIKLNKIAFVVMGDMNWHNHVGIYTTAPRVAIQQNIPLVFWGEHGYTDLCGQFSIQDFPEMNYRERTEHPGRGFDWNFFEGIEGIQKLDMIPWMYPTDNELLNLELRQIYLGHYIPWESNNHLSLVIEKYGFKVSKEPFERTYRVGSNLDDIHENGIHDYLKYIKFGYGRCTDHASKDIRAGILDRDEAIKRVNAMDHIKSKDLDRWLRYVDLSENEFDRIADYFRDPRVWSWSHERGWFKGTIK